MQFFKGYLVIKKTHNTHKIVTFLDFKLFTKYIHITYILLKTYFVYQKGCKLSFFCLRLFVYRCVLSVPNILTYALTFDDREVNKRRHQEEENVP